MERRIKKPKAFARTAVQAGETETVALELPISRIAYYDEVLERFIVEAIEYEIFVGAHSLDPNALTARFMVRSEP